jgi:hypothetical protein
MSQSNTGESKWITIYKIGAVSAVTAVLVALLEIFITFLPGSNAPQDTVLDWFLLFQGNCLGEILFVPFNNYEFYNKMANAVPHV